MLAEIIFAKKSFNIDATTK